jgi:branched-chain amino acid transport system ATP-binding protein
MFKLENIRAGYGEVEVLKGVSLEVRDGQYVAIIGANGHGKTTILRTATGLVKASSGKVLLDGEEITRFAPYKIAEKGLIHVPESARLFPQMTVEENLLAGAYGGSSWGNRGKSLERVFQIFPTLSERRKQLALSLSGGERQMVGIGRGLMAREIKLLMIDEPSAGLAPIVIDEVYRKITEIRKSGVSVAVVEQSPKRIADCDHLYLIENGEVRIHGNPKDVLESDVVKQAYLGEHA